MPEENSLNPRNTAGLLREAGFLRAGMEETGIEETGIEETAEIGYNACIPRSKSDGSIGKRLFAKQIVRR